MGHEVEESAGEEQEGPEIEGDAGRGEPPTLDDPIVLARLEPPVGREEAIRLVGVDQLSRQPLPDLVQVPLESTPQRRCVERRPREHRPAVEPAAKIGLHLPGRGVAVLRASLHRLEGDGLEGLGNLGNDLRRQPGRCPRQLVDVLGDRLAAVGALTSQQLVEHHPQGVDVRTRVDRALGVELLGGHVGERAEAVPRSRIAGRQAEIEELRGEAGAEHDVRRLDVAVGQAQLVGVGQRRCDLGDDPGALAESE